MDRLIERAVRMGSKTEVAAQKAAECEAVQVFRGEDFIELGKSDEDIFRLDELTAVGRSFPGADLPGD